MRVDIVSLQSSGITIPSDAWDNYLRISREAPYGEK